MEIDGGMDVRIDVNWTIFGRWVDAGCRQYQIFLNRTVTEAGWDGHGKWSKKKDLLYYFLLNLSQLVQLLNNILFSSFDISHN